MDLRTHLSIHFSLYTPKQNCGHGSYFVVSDWNSNSDENENNQLPKGCFLDKAII